MEEKNLSYYVNKARELDSKKSLKSIKIALLSNFTIKGLREVISVKCDDISLCSEIYESGYNQINQEIIDHNSGLNKFKPNITFLLFNPKFIFEDVIYRFIQNESKRIDFIEKKINEFSNLINLFLEKSSGILVVSNLKTVAYSPLGISEGNFKMTVKDMAAHFNQKIKEKFKKNNRVFIYDFASFFMKYGDYNITDERLNYLGDIFISPNYMPLLAEDMMSYVKAYCSKNRKCIVLDLDNTLWGGIVGEDGFNDIKLDDKPSGNVFLDFQKHILGLYEKGIILAINSRNNPEDALKVIREHPCMILREKYFASIKINWNDKISNMYEIAKELNIGTDSLIFIDDDPVNRELVRQAMPEVLVVDLPKDSSMYVRTLKEINDFNTLQIGEEDFKKGLMYYQQRQRNDLKTKFKNIEDFLRCLDMKVEIKRADEFTIPRIAQLTKKTNQFNLTTRRYDEEEIKKMTQSDNYLVYSLKLKDKIGDNGIAGAFILKKEGDRLIIDTFLLSCRIIGRNVEQAMLNFISDLALKEKISEIIGEYISTNKNEPCKKMYENNGFDRINERLFRLKNFKKIKPIPYIELIL